MKKILVVDDDVDILSLVQIALSMNNFAVDATPQWEDIDRRIRDSRPDLILLDVSLKGADGRQICKNLKQEAGTADIPVILFSANADMENAIVQCNAQAFIAKPFELPNLVQTIRKYVA
jgi:DNA-binding response OmpR family regulator